MAEANEEDQHEQELEATIQEDLPTEVDQERKPVPVTITDIELEALKNEVQEYKNKYLRLLAESENSRKRLMKERQELIQYSLQNLICDFLTPIDQLDNALKHAEKMSPEVKQWSIGFQMILTQFKDVLSNNNVQYFESTGKSFDPHLHEAVEMILTDEHPSNIVIEECLKGYKMGDRVIRPARVKVTKAPTASSTENNAESADK